MYMAENFTESKKAWKLKMQSYVNIFVVSLCI